MVSKLFNPIHQNRGGGVKAKGTSFEFSPVNFLEVGVSPQNILTFSFSTFAALLCSFKFIPSISPKILNLN